MVSISLLGLCEHINKIEEENAFTVCVLELGDHFVYGCSS